MENVIGKSKSRTDPRYCMLVADTMTYKGLVTPMTRNGMQREGNSVLSLLFEKVNAALKEACSRARFDGIRCTPSATVISKPAPVGAGAVTVVSALPLHKTEAVKNHGLSSSSPAKASATSSELVPAVAETMAIPKRVLHTRKIPCAFRPLSFFQQSVPITRGGKWAEAIELVPTALPFSARFRSRGAHSSHLGPGRIALEEGKDIDFSCGAVWSAEKRPEECKSPTILSPSTPLVSTSIAVPRNLSPYIILPRIFPALSTPTTSRVYPTWMLRACRAKPATLVSRTS
jgi:hypothetical protein